MAKKRSKKSGPEVSLVIPGRGAEKMLGQTIVAAQQRAVGGPPIEIVVVDNGLNPGALPDECRRMVRVVAAEQYGTGQARHAGMLASTAEVVLTIDAHVLLCDGWAEKLVAVFAQDPDRMQGVSCGHVGSLTPKFEPEGPCGYHGARLCWMDKSAEPRPLAAKWIRQPLHERAGDRIGALMGACYAMSRSWYETMHHPWALMTSWGCDEESVSLATACLGGSLRMLPAGFDAWHRFGTAAVQYSRAELQQVWRNRRNLLHLFPFSEEEVEALSTFAGYSAQVPMEFFADQDFLEFRGAFADCRAALVEYLSTWCDGYVEWVEGRRTPVAKDRPAASRIAVIPPQRLAPVQHDRCKQCDGVDTFAVTHVEATMRRYRCKVCGKRAWRPRDGVEMQYSVMN
jgi:hypothetical protein